MQSSVDTITYPLQYNKIQYTSIILMVLIILYMSDFIVPLSVLVNVDDHDHHCLRVCSKACKTCKAYKLKGEVHSLQDQDLNIYTF